MTDNAQPIVFFGASNYAITVFKILSEKFAPVAFGDNDPKKQGSNYLGLPVLSLKDIEQLHPGCRFYVTVFETIRPDVIDSLICAGIVPERIINYEEYKKYVSCEWLETHLFSNFRDSFYKLSFCCSHFGRNESPFVSTERTSFSDAMQKFCALRDTTIESFNRPSADLSHNSCSGCYDVKYRPSFTDRRIRYINFNFPSNCNFKCIYCKVWHTRLGAEMIKQTEYALEFLKSLRVNKYIDDKTLILNSSGEFSIHPMSDVVLDAFQNNPCWFYSNASAYKTRIAEILKTEGSRIVVSLDAGTVETFAKIKGIDLFDKVCGNLYRYSQAGFVELKYIVLPGINDNESDIAGFLGICERLCIQAVDVSRDQFDMQPFGERTLRMIAHMVRGARKLGINLSMPTDCFGASSSDRLRLDEMLK